MKNILLTLLLAGAALLAADKPVKSVRLYVFDCGKLHYDDPTRFGFKKEEVLNYELSVGCYLIVHPKGTLMWDVGVIPDKSFPSDGKPATKFYATASKPLKAQLAEAGYSPDNITYLAMSHSHWDHLANANEFAKSIWLVRPIERDMLFSSNPPERSTPDEYDALKSSRVTLLKDAGYDVFGDGRVVVKPAYGHTPGHSVLYVKLRKTGPVVLSGDLYHYPEEVAAPEHYPVNEFNKDQTRQSRLAMQAFLQKTHSQLWIQHDIAAFGKLRKAPAYYE